MLMKTTILSLGCLLLGACGGKDAVDLGGNSANAGWADTKGSVAATPTASAPAVPETLYNGDYVRAIAVDETTIAAAIQSPDRNHIDICQLANCRGTLQTIYREAFNECPDSGSGSPSRFEHLLISHGEVIWPACTSASGTRLMACAISGCPDGAREISPAGWIQAMAASADWIYWWDRNPDSGIARCPRAGCEVVEFQPMSDANTELFSSGNGAFRLALDESRGVLYASGGLGISRMPTDSSAELTPFYVDPVGVSGLAVVGEQIYFALSTLTGEIRRCPVTGCEQGPELVVLAPRWPIGPIADKKAVYWLSLAQTNFITPSQAIDVVISDFPLDGTATGGIEVASFDDDNGYTMGWESGAPRPVMNSHHVYWSELGGSKTDSFENAIRMVQR
jgi:hypothetical protein